MSVTRGFVPAQAIEAIPSEIEILCDDLIYVSLIILAVTLVGFVVKLLLTTIIFLNAFLTWKTVIAGYVTCKIIQNARQTANNGRANQSKTRALVALAVLGFVVCAGPYGSQTNNSETRSVKDIEESSEVEDFLNLGVVDTYKRIKRNQRPFSRGQDGDKGYVEADHIPPLQSLKMAPRQEGFSELHNTNPDLYEMVMSLIDDPRGENLITMQVPRHNHRDALSTGPSTASQECRLLIARTIARGDGKRMLKQALIIAHPYASQQIREDAGTVNRLSEGQIQLSRDRTMNIYRNGFLGVITAYNVRGIITDEEYKDLVQYVNNDMYLDRDSEEYQEIFDIVKRFGKRQP